MKNFLNKALKAIKLLCERLRLRTSKDSGPGESKIVHVILEEKAVISDERLTDFADKCQAQQKKARDKVLETLTDLDQVATDQPGLSLTVVVNGNRRELINAVESCIPEFKLTKFNRRSIFVEGITWER